MASVQFSIRMDPAIKARLDAEAKLEDRSAAYITQRALNAYFKHKEHLRAVVQSSQKEVDQGVFISGGSMHTWVESWQTENELPPPNPDVFTAK